MAIYGYTKNYKLIKPQFDTDTWHDYMYDNLDTIDAVLSAIFASGDWQGFWKSNTHYNVGGVVIDRATDTMYKVMVEHTTSEATFAAEFAAHPTYYELWSPNNLAESWAIKMDDKVSNADYSAKAYAISSGLIDDGSAKEWAVGSGTIGDTGEYSAKKHATDAHNDYISMTTDANVVAVGTNITSVNTVAGISTDVSTVAANDTNVSTVAGIDSDVTTVATNAAAVSAVAAIDSDVSAVSANNTNISAVAADLTNVDTVAADIANVNVVAGDLTNINTVASDTTNIDTVATNISDVNTAATNITAIQNAPIYAELSEDWATKMDAPVDSNDYSAKWWALQANAERRIGQIVLSTIPLSDAGLHLANGSLISGSGSYADFVSYMAGLVSTYPDLFDTEANWQSSVSTYGVCGKYVYDSVNNTIRLPKIEGFVESTLDPTKLGDLTEAGLPNITSVMSNGIPCAGNGQTVSGAFTTKTANDTISGASAPNNTWIDGFDASLSNSIYGNSTTVQPQSIKVFYYIVIATSTKTDIEVDIDEIATDLNGKADRDLTNLSNGLANTICTTPATTTSTASSATPAVVVKNYRNGNAWYRVWSDGWIEQGGEVSLNNGNATVNLLVAHNNSNYSSSVTLVCENPTTFYSGIIYGKNTTGFTVYQNVGYVYSIKGQWRTEGY